MWCAAVCSSAQVPVLICSRYVFTNIYIYHVSPVLFKICYELSSIIFIYTVITV